MKTLIGHRVDIVRRQFIGKTLEKEVKKPTMEEKEREFLKKFYKDDVDELKKILGRDLPWRNFQD